MCIACLCRQAEDVGWVHALEWIPSHCGAQENDQADLLAGNAHTQQPSFNIG